MLATKERITAQRSISTERYILSTLPTLYVPLWKRDGGSFISDDGIGHICTVTGATWGTQGRTLGGINDAVRVPTVASLNFTSGNFSGGVWFYPTSYDASAQRLIQKGQNNTDGWELYVVSGRLWFLTYQAAATQSSASDPDKVPINNWYKVDFTRTGASAKIYVNGVDSTTTSGTHIDPASCIRDLWIGNTEGGGRNISGILGDALIYNRSPPGVEIMHNYLATKWRYGL